MAKGTSRYHTWEYLRPRVGDISHVISARPVSLTDGPSLGTRAIEVNVFGGITALILIDRGMDIGPAYFKGVPLHWTSSTGIRHPGLFQDHDWLRSFQGGLMITAGLRNVGPGFTQDDEVQPLHGRISNTPAFEVSHVTEVDSDGIPTLTVSGKIQETSVFGCNLILTRNYKFKVGSPVIILTDKIVNEGFSKVETLVLYHFNLGFPVISDNSELLVDSDRVESRENLSGDLEKLARRFIEPEKGADAQVFEHFFDASSNLRCMGVWNPSISGGDEGIGLAIRYRAGVLSHLWQWRMMGEGMYLTGIEPSNCGILGRLNNSTAGTILEPKESFETQIEIIAFNSKEELSLSKPFTKEAFFVVGEND